VAADWESGDRDDLARVLAGASVLADLLDAQISRADAIAGGDDTVATRLLVERLLRLRHEDRHLLALVSWFAATHDVAGALAALRGPGPRAYEGDQPAAG
jgi:hypothetical protein